jgi:hypothetical protein
LTTEISDYQRARTPLSLDEVFVPAPVRYRTSFASATGWDRYDELIAHDGTKYNNRLTGYGPWQDVSLIDSHHILSLPIIDNVLQIVYSSFVILFIVQSTVRYLSTSSITTAQYEQPVRGPLPYSLGRTRIPTPPAAILRPPLAIPLLLARHVPFRYT